MRMKNNLTTTKDKMTWQLIYAVGRLLDDKYTEGDVKTRNALWKDMHRKNDLLRKLLQST